MFKRNSVVKVVSVTDPDYCPRQYKRLGNILLNDYRGSVCKSWESESLVKFNYPRWFDDDTTAPDGLTYLFVSNSDIALVANEQVTDERFVA
jgi:hypothetical protein